MFSGYIDLCESLPSVQINNSLIAQIGNNDFVAEAKSAERPKSSIDSSISTLLPSLRFNSDDGLNMESLNRVSIARRGRK